MDPLTRKPKIPQGDLDEIGEYLNPHNSRWSYSNYVFQNAKFDVAALASVRQEFGDAWMWGITYDTLLAGHLLASNQPHNLTDMAIHWLGVDINPLEYALEDACKKARQRARTAHKDWKIAKEKSEDTPSAKEKCWKYDMWLPRAVAFHEGYKEDHPWWTVLRDYSNTDSAVTLQLFQVQMAEIKRRDLWEIYLERMKSVEAIYQMEHRGVTLSKARLQKLYGDYTEESARSERVCKGIAAKRGYDLTLPKSGNNKSLTTFVFDTLKLPTVATTDKGNPSLDKNVLEHYQATLTDPDQLEFVTNLRGKRKRDTALSYMESYLRFMVPLNGEDGDYHKLHPSVNPVGTDTLRCSSSNPNEQNISKQEGFNLRYAFGPGPGREWWAFDYENIELRIPAYESGEQELIELFERSEEPPYYGSVHLLNFSTVYPDIWEKELAEVGLAKVGPHCKKKYASTYYQWCKNGDFAVQYGAIDRVGGTADKAFHRVGSHARLKSRFNKLEALNQKYIHLADKLGYVETLPDKTVNPRRGYPILCTRTQWGRVLPTVPLNYHVQSTAMWCTMKAMNRCQERLKQWNTDLHETNPKALGYYMTMQVHDEIDFDFPKGTGREPWRTNLPKIRMLKRLMEQSGQDIGIPLRVSVEYIPNNWAEGVKVAA